MGPPDATKPSLYNNNNFALLQIMINCIVDLVLGVPGNVFASYVQNNVLKPMGVDTTIFNTTLKIGGNTTDALCYSGVDDTNPG